jgi:hypothetical protein
MLHKVGVHIYMRWAGDEAGMGEESGAYICRLGDRGVDGRTILKWILKKWYKVSWKIHVAQDAKRWRAFVNAR